MGISRKSFLQGAACATAGAAVGGLGRHWLVREPPREVQTRFLKREPRSFDSFSQCGEDRIVDFLCGYLGITPVDYIDVGAHDPVVGNNTYYFYQKNCHGVLIEPNPEMCKKLREVRSADIVIEAGVGASAVREADYYVMTDSSWNTFSREEAEREATQLGGTISIKQVIKVPLLDINQVMADQLRRAPAFLSIDVQGLELAILKSIDYGRFRPKVICVETLVTGTRATNPAIATFMSENGYVVRGMTFVNTIFVDAKLI